MNLRNLHVRAQQDISEIFDHYETEASAAVALTFLSAVERGILHLVGHPLSGSLRWQRDAGIDGLRVWPVSGFPYLLFYKPEDPEPTVLRVLHTARDIPASLRD